MQVEIKQVAPWSRALDAARWTVRKELTGKEPSAKWIWKILRAEHSPIRLVEYDIKLTGIPYWVAMHFVRHHEGVQWFCSTQRDDRIIHDISREKMSQDTPINVMMSINAQALINISRKRMCTKAAEATRAVWRAIIAELGKVDPVMQEACVPECVYRGFCPELQSCKWCDTEAYRERTNRYRGIE